MTLTVDKNCVDNMRKNSNQRKSDAWKPLLLMIPLRLGLNDINPIYIPALKKCFEIEENCGMIGGRPNQALYFIGYVGDEVLYLDPHTTQRSGSVGEKTSQDEIEFDSTFHQKYAGRIPFSGMDPSLAVVNIDFINLFNLIKEAHFLLEVKEFFYFFDCFQCFLCKTHVNFKVLLDKLRTTVLVTSNPPLFEIVQTRSPEWISSVVGN